MEPSSRELNSTDASAELYRLAAVAGGVTSFTELSEKFTEIAGPVVGAANFAVAIVVPREQAIRVYQGPTGTWGTSQIRLVSLNELTPLTDAIRDGSPVIVRSMDEFTERYPNIAVRIEPGEVTAMAAYPLLVEDQTVGACFFRFSNGGIDEQSAQYMSMLLPLLAVAVARLQYRTELEAHAAQLRRSNEDLENFAAVVAHDFSAPVRRIGSYLQLIEEETPDLSVRARRYIQKVQSQIAHLDELLRDTLAYSRVIGGQLRVETVDVAALADDVVRDMRAELEAVGGRVDVSALPTVEAERSLLSEVLRNLIDNALKYRHLDRLPEVSITAEPDHFAHNENRQWWKISVGDNGIGIAIDRRDEVFDMFARLEVSDDRPGTGVGLAFVKRVVEGHHGTVGVDTSPAGGTTIWFTLPGLCKPDQI